MNIHRQHIYVISMSRSPIWRWFYKVNESDQVKAKCKACESEGMQITLRMAKGTTSSIIYHFQHKHPEEWKQFQIEERAEKAKKLLQNSNNNAEVKFTDRGEKRSHAGASNKWLPRSDDQLTRDMAIMEWLASDNLPFNLVNTPAFSKMMGIMCKKYNVKHSSTFAKYFKSSLIVVLKIVIDIRFEPI